MRAVTSHRRWTGAGFRTLGWGGPRPRVGDPPHKGGVYLLGGRAHAEVKRLVGRIETEAVAIGGTGGAGVVENGTFEFSTQGLAGLRVGERWIPRVRRVVGLAQGESPPSDHLLGGERCPATGVGVVARNVRVAPSDRGPA